jgi:hypothetical protein
MGAPGVLQEEDVTKIAKIVLLVATLLAAMRLAHAQSPAAQAQSSPSKAPTREATVPHLRPVGHHPRR